MNMFYQEKNNTMAALFATIGEKGFEGMGEAIQILMNEAMKVERNRFLGAMPYERNSNRDGYANGYKDKTVKTRVGQINLQVPQVIGLWTKLFPRALNFIQKNNFSKLNYLILGRI